jgi:hypothetical protein
MAKKKETKPVQHSAAKPAKSYKFLIWAGVIVVIVIILFLMRGAKEKPVTAPTVAPTEKAPVEKETAPVKETGEKEIPKTAPGESLVPDEEIQTGDYTQASRFGEPQNSDAALARDLTAEPERFSNFKCTFDENTGLRYLSLKVTNTNKDVSFMISPVGVKKGYNTYFMTRGNIDMDPGCGVEELAPGESTVCEKIGPENLVYTLTTGTNRLTIQSPNDDSKMISEAVVINCED